MHPASPFVSFTYEKPVKFTIVRTTISVYDSGTSSCFSVKVSGVFNFRFLSEHRKLVYFNVLVNI